jgi:hypothetical protein
MSPNEPNFSEEPTSNTAAAAAGKAWETAKAKVEDGYVASEQYVREHPGTSVATVFAIGFAMGLLVGWAAAHEEHQSFWERAKGFPRHLSF